MSFSDREIVRSYLMRGQQHFMTLKKSDGRIEVPRLLINEMEWTSKRWAYFFRAPDAILIYPSNDGDPESFLGKVAVSAGRIRVPLNILNKIGFCGRAFAVSKENDHLSVQPYGWDRGEELDKFIDTLGPLQLRMLSNFILGKPVDSDTEQLTRPKLRANPIFLASKANTVFRAIGLPFRFYGIYVQETKEILISAGDHRERCPVFHAIPGIRRDNRGSTIGFLIVNSTTYGSIIAALQTARKTDPDVELLFIYDPISEGMYRAYVNPPSEVFNRDVDVARMVCSDADGFMSGGVFRRLASDPDKRYPEPPVLTDDNVCISGKSPFEKINP